MACKAAIGLLLALAGTAGCGRPNTTLVFTVVDADGDGDTADELAGVQRIEVVMAREDGYGVMPEDTTTFLGVRFLAAGSEYRVIVDLDVVAPAIVDGLTVELRAPSDRPTVNVTGLVADRATAFSNLRADVPGRIEFRRGSAIEVALVPDEGDAGAVETDAGGNDAGDGG